ncbi:metal-dependent hydrolase [Carpediemonas membranifera]|uniref:Metal-dependent hydrolase n=1 Tax=Carpediemonas membranifera TaxID=201153 RepID=A0A8J6E0K3_9EUKA|nr:metal-dependent hydrolase [Carpediemonas membranifera]|eukprot:KAG9392348.1 metal-dependent hydrolase [Carpediemonas membranifera]
MAKVAIPFEKKSIGGTNVFLVANEERSRYILVDVGLASDHKKVLKFLKDSGVSYDQIEVIFLTHRHSDHVQGTAKLLAKFEEAGVKPLVIAHSDEVPFIRDGVLEFPRSLTAITAVQAAMFNALKDTWMGKKMMGIPPIPQIQAWSGDADQLRAMGYPVKILHTPGHTSGGLSLMVEDHVITGDVSFNLPFAPLKPLFGDDEAVLRENWVTFAKEGAAILHPSHGNGICMKKLRAKFPGMAWPEQQ